MSLLDDFVSRLTLYRCSGRDDEDHVDDAFLKLKSMLEQLLGECDKETLRILFVIVAWNRDIVGGRGERRLTYMMLEVWYAYYPVVAVCALDALLSLGYGSWRDVPGLCCALRPCPQQQQEQHLPPFVETAVEMMVRKLKRGDADSAVVAKWVPRETSKKKLWLFELFVQTWFSGTSRVPSTEQRRAFRRIISNTQPCCTNRPVKLLSLLEHRWGERRLETWVHRALHNEKGLDAAWERYVQLYRRRRGPMADGDGGPRQKPCSNRLYPWIAETLLHLWDNDTKEEKEEEEEVVVVALNPLVIPDHVCIRRSDGFTHNVSVLLSKLEHRKMNTTTTTESQSPWKKMVDHPRYVPMGRWFDALVYG